MSWLIDLMHIHFYVFRYMLKTKDWGFAFFVTISTDALQHKYFHDSKCMIELFRELYRVKILLDKTLSSNYRLVILSDHGFGVARKVFNINYWFYKRGLIKLRKRELVFRKEKLLLSRLTKFLEQSKDYILPFIPKGLRQRIWMEASSRGYTLEDIIDMDETIALGYGNSGTIYVNTSLSIRERLDVVKMIKEELCRIGASVFTKKRSIEVT